MNSVLLACGILICKLIVRALIVLVIAVPCSILSFPFLCIFFYDDN